MPYGESGKPGASTSGQSSHDRGGKQHQATSISSAAVSAFNQQNPTLGTSGSQDGPGNIHGGPTVKDALKEGARKKQLRDLALKGAKDKQKDVKQLSFKDKFKLKSSDHRKKELRKLFDYIHGGRKMQLPGWSSLTRKADWDDEDYLEFANMSPMEFQARLGTDFSMKDIDKLREIGQALGQDNLSQTGKFKGDNKFAFEDFYPNMNQQSAGGGGGDGQRGGYMGYPSYEAWKAAQGAQGT